MDFEKRVQELHHLEKERLHSEIEAKKFATDVRNESRIIKQMEIIRKEQLRPQICEVIKNDAKKTAAYLNPNKAFGRIYTIDSLTQDTLPYGRKNRFLNILLSNDPQKNVITNHTPSYTSNVWLLRLFDRDIQRHRNYSDEFGEQRASYSRTDQCLLVDESGNLITYTAVSNSDTYKPNPNALQRIKYYKPATIEQIVPLEGIDIVLSDDLQRQPIVEEYRDRYIEYVAS